MNTPMNMPAPKPDAKIQKPESAATASPETDQQLSTHTQRSEMNSPKKTSSTGKTGAENQNAIDLLKTDHQEVDQLFEKFKNAKGRQRKKLVDQIAVALRVHTIIEEEIFYPACRKQGVEEDNLDEAQVEHDTLKLLVREILEGNQDDDYFDAKVTVLSEYVKHHVKEEEAPENGIFARAEKADIDLDELGQELKDRKEELMEDEEELLDRSPRIRSLHLVAQSSRSSSRGYGLRNEGQRGGEWADREDYSDYYNEGGRYPRGYRANPESRFESQRGWRPRDH